MNARTRLLAAPLLAVATVAAGCGAPFDVEQALREALHAYRTGDLELALATAEQGSRRSQSGEDRHWKARFDLLRAKILLARAGSGDIEQAEALIARSYEVAKDDPSIRARWHLMRGYVDRKRSRYEDALVPLEEAFQLAVRESLTDVAVEARNLQGQALSRLQRWDEAEDRWREALALARRSEDRFRGATALLNLGYRCLGGRRYDEAITYLEQAADLAEAEGVDLLRAAALLNLSLSWVEVGDLDRAVVAAREAVKIYRRAGTRLYLCQGLGSLGTIQKARGELDDAIVSFREAVTIARELNTEVERGLWSVEMAGAVIEKGELDEARAWIDAAREAYLAAGDSEGLAVADLTDAALAVARGDDDRVVELCEAVATAFPDEPALLWRARAEIARAFVRSGRPDDALASFAAAVASIREDRNRLSRLESRASFLTLPITVYRDFVALLLEMGREDDALRAMESCRAQTLLDGLEELAQRPLEVADLVRLARDHDIALLSYWISPRGSFAWAFTPQGSRRIPLPGTDSLDALVAGHLSAIAEGWRDPLEEEGQEGGSLYRLLVAPVLEAVPGGSRVIVVPDGPLYRLNLETLIAETPSPHYLIEDWTVAVSPALSILLAGAPRRREAGRSILLVGDPVESDPDFPRLPHASRELDAIASRLADIRQEQLRDTQATAKAVLDRIVGSHDWIHVAAHAQAGSGNPLDSAVVLSPDEGGSKLYARDLVGRRIDAELVTLSACRSAGSRAFSGEGLVGLAWAFMRAGTRRVIAGLWDVSDRSTAVLMEDLYAGLSDGADAADALRSAKLRLLHGESSFSKPYYWGPFQLYTRSPRDADR